MLFTINYNTTGIPLDKMCDMVLGGFYRANVPDIKISDTNFKGILAKKITGTIEGKKIEIIAFYSPSSKFSYVMSQDLLNKELERILDNVTLKGNKTPFVDFDTIWKHFYGDKNEWDINQPIDEGFVLEGWNYDRDANKLQMKLILDLDATEIKIALENQDFAERFIEEMSEGQILIPLAKNYGKVIEIIIKDKNGNIAVSLPIM